MMKNKELCWLEKMIMSNSLMVNKLNTIARRKGKETGQRFSTEIEELVIKILKGNLGSRVSSPTASRSMYDLKIDNDVFNVKFGMEVMGCPNVVSTKNLMDAYLKCKIDSYYLIKIKYINGVFDLKIFDILNYLDYIPFATDKQAKIEEKRFYDNYIPILDDLQLAIKEKSRILMGKWNDMWERRCKNDTKTKNKIKTLYKYGY